MEDDGRVDDDKRLDYEVRRKRHAREKYWMLKLQTIFPFGLNDTLGDRFKCNSDKKLITRKYPKLDRNFMRLTKGNHKVINNVTAEKFLEKLKNILNDNVKEAMNFICINLNHFKINVLKKIAVLTEDYIIEEEDN